MLRTYLAMCLVMLPLSQSLAADPAPKLSPQDLESLKQKVEPTLQDPKLKDIIIHLKPGGNETNACIIRPDGSVCCGSKQGCEQQN
ncbi:hypothetical protein ACTGJ9_038810 [Bradyrhizobium sp. RDM12]